MKKLVIKKLENKFYICEDKDAKFYAIEVSEMPETAKIGNEITIDDNGTISVN